jgi:prevent-host-death family protein
MSANANVIEVGIRDLRTQLSDVLNEVAVRGQIAYVTNRGRRIAAIVPVPIAEAAEVAQQPGEQPSA